MKNKRMPDLKVTINLNPNVVPTIRSKITDSTLAVSERNKRADRREFSQFTSELLTTSTPKKEKLIKIYQNNADLSLEPNDCSLIF